MSESDEVKLVERLRVSHDRVSEFPEARGMAVIMDLLALRNIVPEAADTIERLVAERDEARSTFNATTASQILKATKDRAEAAEAEVVRLRAILNAAEKDCHKARFALQTIGESTVPDQPASSGLSELEHVQHHHTQLRRLAIMTLRPEAIGIYEAPRRDADEIRVRGVGRDLFEPRSIRVALTERPTDDEIRSMHDWMRGWKL